MTVRNANLGGLDWSNGNILNAADLNDTFDEIGEIWYLNSNLYTVYDAFTTEVSATLWTLGGTDVPTWSNSSNAGGDAAGEASVAHSGTLIHDSTMESISIPANVGGIFAKIQSNVNFDDGVPPGDCIIVFDGTEYDVGLSTSGAGACAASGALATILILRTATNTYDIYISGKKVATGISNADPQITFKIETFGTGSYTSGASMYVADVRYRNW